MTRHPITLIALGIGTSIGITQDASAIIMRHDVDESEYLVEDESHPALVDLFGAGDCIGTLIDASHLLTVAHCAEDLNSNQSLTVNGESKAIGGIIMHPEWGGWLHDIALVRFEDPVEGVDPLPIYRDTDELDQTLILYGRGMHGTGIEGEPGASDDGKLRRATNVVSSVTAAWIEVTFEEPGEQGITDLEGVGAAGDSGGPAFIETGDGLFIAGLNSWGDADQGTQIGQYGAYDYSTRVSQYAEWIDSELGVTGGGDTDQPGTGDDSDDNPDDDGDPDTGDDTDDSASAEDAAEDDGKSVGGCGCASGPSPQKGLSLVALMGLFGALRRRSKTTA